ncbi:hypothetical protein VTO42DRAFT_3014 [Malbranchea cinnamomea]
MNRFLRGLSVLSTSFARSMSTSSNRTSIAVFRDVPPLREYRRKLLLSGRTLGMVPTMGALHEGHLSLARQAAAENTDVLVTIFVNPTQFAANEDLDSYPRTWDADMEKLEALNQELAAARAAAGTSSDPAALPGRITAVFAPTANVMYPTLPPTSDLNGDGSFVTITPLSRLLEGASRPVFFRGVATVCMKLFNIATADRAYFGQKDVQQTVVIKRMVKDFHINTDIKICPTKREQDGLAMSSRNVYLGTRRRKVGLVLINALKEAEKAALAGSLSRVDILGAAHGVTDAVFREQESLPPSLRAKFDVDYISLADPDTLQEVDVVDPSKGAVLSGAIKMRPVEDPQPGEELGLGEGQVPVRLIDNIIIPPSP